LLPRVKFLIDTASCVRLFPCNVSCSFLNHRNTLQWSLLTSNKYVYSRFTGVESVYSAFYQRDELPDECFAVPSGASSDKWRIQLRLCLVLLRQGPALCFKGNQRRDSPHISLRKGTLPLTQAITRYLFHSLNPLQDRRRRRCPFFSPSFTRRPAIP